MKGSPRALRWRRRAAMGLAAVLVACSGGSDEIQAPAILAQPANRSVVIGQPATFRVTATSGALQWRRNGVPIPGAMGAAFTLAPTQAADNGARFDVVASNDLGQATSTTASLSLIPAPVPISVLTQHDDVGRSGLNAAETVLSTSSVNAGNFGLVGDLATDGHVDAQPLLVSGVTVGGVRRNVLIVATEHASVYAFDADTLAKLWQVSVLGAGESPGDPHTCDQISPEIGITATPVIDLNQGAPGVGALYVVATSRNGAGQVFQRLHALDLASGLDLVPAAQVVGVSTNNAGTIGFVASQYAERSALLESNGQLFLAWTSHCDLPPYNGWVMRFSASTLQEIGVLTLTPSGSDGGIWMAGGGPAADAAGGVYLLDGNGTFDTSLDANGFPSQGDFGNAFVRLDASAPLGMGVADYFAMHDTAAESAADIDLGSGGVMAMPDLVDAGGVTRHLAVGAGKDARIYLVNRDAMGKFNAASDAAIYQEIAPGLLAGPVFSSPAYFAQTVYYGAVNDHLKAIPLVAARLAAQPASQSATAFAYPGTTPSISANGTLQGIVWAVENAGSQGVLHAYDATNLASELYSSAQAGDRDAFADNKFITPMIANGRVYVGTPGGVAVFGILP